MPGRQKNTYTGEKTLVVTQVRSAIGNKPKAVGTLRALGLGRIGQSNTLPDRAEIRAAAEALFEEAQADAAAEENS